MASEAFKIVSANIYQGLVYEGKQGPKDVFSKYWPSVYQDQYASLNPDIVCLSEVPLDDGQGNSTFLDEFAQTLGAVSCRVDVHERSWLVKGKYYGNAILSKIELHNYQALRLPHPQPPIEYDRPDGQHWVLHDKSVQSADVYIGGRAIRLFNLHYFPFFLFGRNMNEPELQPSRQAFIEQLRLDDGVPTILAGDFNNGDDHLEVAFPELFAQGKLVDAVRFDAAQFDDRYVGGNFQLDHILYTSGDFAVEHSRIVRDDSDHRGLAVDFTIR